jgi:phosphoglycolate phosphatase-like HAD superfamily hydrolase
MFVVFDLDGTLANLDHRLHLSITKDWRGFFAAVGNDKPIVHAILVAQAMWQAGHRVEIWSGRSDECRAETERWLALALVPYDALLMRTAGDVRPDDVIKQEFLRGGGQPDLIFDDRDRVVAMWRSLGIPCFQVAKGDF